MGESVLDVLISKAVQSSFLSHQDLGRFAPAARSSQHIVLGADRAGSHNAFDEVDNTLPQCDRIAS